MIEYFLPIIVETRLSTVSPVYFLMRRKKKMNSNDVYDDEDQF